MRSDRIAVDAEVASLIVRNDQQDIARVRHRGDESKPQQDQQRSDERASVRPYNCTSCRGMVGASAIEDNQRCTDVQSSHCSRLFHDEGAAAFTARPQAATIKFVLYFYPLNWRGMMKTSAIAIAALARSALTGMAQATTTRRKM